MPSVNRLTYLKKKGKEKKKYHSHWQLGRKGRSNFQRAVVGTKSASSCLDSRHTVHRSTFLLMSLGLRHDLEMTKAYVTTVASQRGLVEEGFWVQ